MAGNLFAGGRWHPRSNADIDEVLSTRGAVDCDVARAPLSNVRGRLGSGGGGGERDAAACAVCV